MPVEGHHGVARGLLAEKPHQVGQGHYFGERRIERMAERRMGQAQRSVEIRLRPLECGAQGQEYVLVSTGVIGPAVREYLDRPERPCIEPDAIEALDQRLLPERRRHRRMTEDGGSRSWLARGQQLQFQTR